MKWFKHYSDAATSESLAIILEELGFDGYGRYWRLLEFLSEKWDGETDTIRVHRRNVRETLRFRTWDKLASYLDRIQLVPGINVVSNGNVLEFSVAILSDLKSKDFKKSRRERDPTAPKIKNKDKDKDKDLDKEKEPPLPPKGASDTSAPRPTDILKIYNDELGDALPNAKAITQQRRNQITTCRKNIPELQTREGWQAYFRRVRQISFLTGDNDRGWRADFDWLLKTANAIKVAEGRYDNLHAKSNAQKKYESMRDMENPYAS